MSGGVLKVRVEPLDAVDPLIARAADSRLSGPYSGAARTAGGAGGSSVLYVSQELRLCASSSGALNNMRVTPILHSLR